MAPLIFLLCVVVSVVQAQVSTERHYVFTAPKVLLVGSEERMCLQLYNTPETGRLSLRLLGNDDEQELSSHSEQVSGVADGANQSCFSVHIPKTDAYWGTLHVRVDFDDGVDYVINGTLAITFRRLDRQLLLVQTDKSLYKPGQLVKLRVLNVHSPSLLPVITPVALVFIESPSGTRLAQWNNVTTRNGLVQLDFQLSEQPELGEWKISVKSDEDVSTSKTFKVETYVLPKFSVDIISPAFIMVNDPSVSWKVCAVYTYGKPVRGTATLKVTADYSREVVVEKSAHTGDDRCVKFEVTASDLGIGRKRYSPHNFKLNATFEEDETELTFSAEKSDRIHRQRLQISSPNSYDKHFKPGLPYSDQISVKNPDNTPAPDVLIEICYRLKMANLSRNQDGSINTDSALESDMVDDDGSAWNLRRNSTGAICNNLTSDSSGIITFVVPALSQEVYKIDFRADAPEYAEVTLPPTEWGHRPVLIRSASLSFSITGWFSPTGHFLQLPAPFSTHLVCGQQAVVPVHFTARLPSQFPLYYQVLGRGNILHTGSMNVDFSQNQPLYSDGELVLQAPEVPVLNTMPTGEVKLHVDVTADMASDFKLLVYTVVDGQLVADSQSYQVAPCLANNVSLQWTQQRVRPGDLVSLQVTSAANSLCGLDIVDKSVNLLGNSHRVRLEDIFRRLKEFNIGRYDGRPQQNDYEYCQEKHGEANIELELRPVLPLEELEEMIIPEPTKLEENGGELVDSPDEELSGAEEDNLTGPPAQPIPVTVPSTLAPLSRAPRQRRSTWGRHWGGSFWESPYVDTVTAFDMAASAVVSDFQLPTRPCQRHQGSQPEFAAIALQSLGGTRPSITTSTTGSRVPPPTLSSSSAGGAPGSSEPEPVDTPQTVRTHFPETWLFDLVETSKQGEATWTSEAPDTITEWKAGAVCSSASEGLGVAPTAATLVTFQPFFVRATIPYSLQRNETLNLKVSIFNYEQHDLPVALTFIDTENRLELLSNRRISICVSPNRPQVVVFQVRSQNLGEVNMTVMATVDSEYPLECGPETVVAFQDAITRPILVVPEGFPREYTKSSFICVAPDNNELTSGMDEPEVSWTLTLPEDVVEGSEWGRVTVVGDLLGPSLENLDGLVRMPTGCGEQNMVRFVPNIVVMDYLVTVGELTESLKEKLISHMKIGYQRELTYRRKDHSYSAFGNSDKSGSLWLTAFVVRSLSQASGWIDVDARDLRVSVDWLQRQQVRLTSTRTTGQTGCFRPVGTVLHKAMKGGVAEGGEVPLTAYVVASLLYTKVSLDEETISGAFRCLDQSVAEETHIYTITLRAHAYALAGKWDKAQADFERLLERANTKGGLLWWEPDDGDNSAVMVETTSYNLLTAKLLMKHDPSLDYFARTLGMARWISRQRSGHGGFYSTQDTVLALQALARFSADLPRLSDQDRLTVSVNNTHQQPDSVTSSAGYDEAAGAAMSEQLDNVNVTRDNRLVTQRRRLLVLPSVVSVVAEGTGCALVQAEVYYNVKKPEPNEVMHLEVKSEPRDGQKKCLKHDIEICASYTQEDGESNMALIELSMLSGFVPVKGSLDKLTAKEELGVKRWELTTSGSVALYLDALTQEPLCLKVAVQREEIVDDVKPASVSVTDYYRPERTVSQSYTLDVDCEKMPIPRPVPFVLE